MVKRKKRLPGPDELARLIERDLTELARGGRLLAAHGVEPQVAEVVALLTRGGRAPLLAGEAGVGKSAIVHAVARAIAASGGQLLDGAPLVEVSIAGVFARASTPKQAAELFERLLEQLARQQGTIVYARDAGLLHASSLVPPLIAALQAGKLRFLLEADGKAAQELHRGDEALAERLHLVPVAEPTPERARWAPRPPLHLGAGLALALSLVATGGCDCGDLPAGMGGPADAAGDFARTRAGPPPTLEEFVSALVAKECELAAHCEAIRPDHVGSWFCRETPEDLVRWALAQVEDGRRVYFPEDARACLAALPTLGCEGLGVTWTEIWNRVPCDALRRLEVPLGGDCDDEELVCEAAGVCSEEVEPRHCVVTQPGEECQPGRCVAGQLCVDEACRQLPVADEACEQGVGCAGALVCSGSPTSPEGLRCIPPPGAGSACPGQPSSCAGELLCLATPGGPRLCQPGRVEGEPCLVGALALCGAGLRCMEGKCVAIAGPGQPCQLAARPDEQLGLVDSCVVSQHCVSGRCAGW